MFTKGPSSKTTEPLLERQKKGKGALCPDRLDLVGLGLLTLSPRLGDSRTLSGSLDSGPHAPMAGAHPVKLRQSQVLSRVDF